MGNNKLNIIVERNIPFIEGLLEPYGTVRYLESEEITAEAVRDADAIFVRTRTRCDEALLGGSRCQFVATATIGFDHIDGPWCAAHGIEAVNAPGCNAPAVAQYVMASIMTLANRPISQYTIGIIGVGHVGGIVERWARRLDMNVLVNDPPRQAAEGGDHWSTVDEICRRADIITIHTPLDPTTRHLADAAFFAKLERHPILINAARGPIVDTEALCHALDAGQVHHAVIDCWEGEPRVPSELLRRASIATPHIAGYSYEGKVRATRMALDAFSRHFGLPRIEMAVTVADGAAEKVNVPMVLRSYDPMEDDRALRAHPDELERLRNYYKLRHEVREGKID